MLSLNELKKYVKYVKNIDICSSAAEHGQLDYLQYAHENGCFWNKLTCSSSAENGHLNCLQYAHTQGCPWDIWTCSEAAKNGHLDCLKIKQKKINVLSTLIFVRLKLSFPKRNLWKIFYFYS
jgi:hypothetical protein